MLFRIALALRISQTWPWNSLLLFSSCLSLGKPEPLHISVFLICIMGVTLWIETDVVKIKSSSVDKTQCLGHSARSVNLGVYLHALPGPCGHTNIHAHACTHCVCKMLSTRRKPKLHRSCTHGRNHTRWKTIGAVEMGFTSFSQRNMGMVYGKFWCRRWQLCRN